MDWKKSSYGEITQTREYPTWSPDGTLIVWSSDVRIQVMNADGAISILLIMEIILHGLLLMKLCIAMLMLITQNKYFIS